jgi:hypothetical protein
MQHKPETSKQKPMIAANQRHRTISSSLTSN